MSNFESSTKRDDKKTLVALHRARKNGIRMNVIGAGGLSMSPNDLAKSKKIQTTTEKVEALFSFS
tara:strand:- start:395 stop:589 length:195 start_codon:yes stop_codon:yes gene_type:complete